MLTWPRPGVVSALSHTQRSGEVISVWKLLRVFAGLTLWQGLLVDG